MLSCDMVPSPTYMRSKIHRPWVGVPSLLETMSDHVRLGRGIEVPTFPVDSVVRAVVFAGLASTSGEVVGLLAGTVSFFLADLRRCFFLLGATGDGTL
jgi:hypothetical protein